MALSISFTLIQVGKKNPDCAGALKEPSLFRHKRISFHLCVMREDCRRSAMKAPCCSLG